jgi:hypothetical protein
MQFDSQEHILLDVEKNYECKKSEQNWDMYMLVEASYLQIFVQKKHKCCDMC